jgi:hypothetical protein
MEWINRDDPEEFVCGIFTNSVRIQDSQSPTVMSILLLDHRLKASCKLQLVDTMMDRLAISCTPRNWAFVATMAHTNPVCDMTLLGFGRLVGQGALCRAQSWQGCLQCTLIRKHSTSFQLLLPPQLLDVLVFTISAYLMVAARRQ